MTKSKSKASSEKGASESRAQSKKALTSPSKNKMVKRV